MDDPAVLGAADLADTPLVGRRVAMPLGDRLEPLARRLEAWGAQVMRCALTACEPPADARDFRRWLDAVLRGRLADMVWLTPDGVRQTVRLAAQEGRDWEMIASLRRVRHFVAGRETGRALQLLGLSPDFATPSSTTDLIAALRKHNLIGRAVGLQMHHPQASEPVVAFLQWMRTDLHAFSPYRLRSADDAKTVRVLLARILSGRLDAIAFGSADETRLLRALAHHAGHETLFAQRLSAMHVIAPSRRVAAELEQTGIESSIVPERSLWVDPRCDHLLARLRTPRVTPN